MTLDFTTYLNVSYGLKNLGCRQLEECYRVNHGKSSVTSFSKKANEKTLNSIKKFFCTQKRQFNVELVPFISVLQEFVKNKGL